VGFWGTGGFISICSDFYLNVFSTLEVEICTKERSLIESEGRGCYEISLEVCEPDGLNVGGPSESLLPGDLLFWVKFF
jgi:hypothetical protein